MSGGSLLLTLRQINICLGLYENEQLSDSIITLAKKRFEEPVSDERQFFSIGSHSHNELWLLPDVLRRMSGGHAGRGSQAGRQSQNRPWPA